MEGASSGAAEILSCDFFFQGQLFRLELSLSADFSIGENYCSKLSYLSTIYRSCTIFSRPGSRHPEWLQCNPEVDRNS